MIYILKAHVDYEGFSILCATSTITSMVGKIQKMISEGNQNFGEKCTVEIFSGIGTSIGEFNLAHSEIPGKRISFHTIGAGEYQEPNLENYFKFSSLLHARAHKVKREFANSKNIV